MEKRKVLGRGLDTLLPSRQSSAAVASAAAPSVPAPTGDAVHQLPLEVLDRNPYQTRTHINEAGIDELAASITASGVLQPITVRPVVGGRYQVITGERRWLASTKAGKKTIPALVRQASNEQAMQMTIVENLQREDLNPIEEARAFERLSKEFGLTQEQIAIRTGKDRGSIANYVRLLKLPEEVQGMVERGEVTMGHAKVLLTLDSEAGMIAMGRKIVAENLTIRRTEEFVNHVLHPTLTTQPPEAPPTKPIDPNVRDAQQQLERALGVRVTIKDRGGKGRILLQYSSLEDFDRILEALSGD